MTAPKPNLDMQHVYASAIDARFAPWLCARLLPHVPVAVTPNQLTCTGCLAGVAAGICFYLASFRRAWLLVAVVGMVLWWLADHLDGQLARSRRMVSERGYFLDIMLDSAVFMSIFIGLALSTYAEFRIMIFGAILYLLHDQLASLWIHLRSQFRFPATGPTEVILALALFSLLTLVWDRRLVRLGGLDLGWFDVGALVMMAWALFELLASARRLYHLLD